MTREYSTSNNLNITANLQAALTAALLSVYCANHSFHVARYDKFSKAILWIAGGFAPLAYAALYTGVLAFAREISLT